MKEELLPIGRFAKLCRLSVKQLRHYDELGLLAPAQVDPDSGYRYYRAEQARDAVAIGLLRSLDVPLSSIGRVLSGDDVAEVLGSVRERLDAELDRRRRSLAVLDRVLTRGLPDVPVTVSTEPARRVRVVRERATESTISETTGRCVARLLSSGPLSGQMIGLFPVELSEEFTVAVAVEVGPGGGSAGPSDDSDTLGTAGSDGGNEEVLPGGTFAVATHVGPYPEIPLTAHGLLAWCGQHGHVPVGPVREVYLTHPPETPPERLVTQLMIPLEESP